MDYRPQLDLTPQVLSLEVPPDRDDTPLTPLPRPGAMLPAALLAVKAKLFSDGLMAAVELAADAGCGRLPSRRRLLQTWHDACPSNVLATALQLRDHALPGLDDKEVKPISFYTWTPQLEGIFRSDRYLQRPLPPEEFARVAPWAPAEAYHAHLTLATRLTNQLVDDEPERALFPPSQAPETNLARKLLGKGPVPPGFDLVQELLNAVKTGEVTLAPDGGWYTHQQWPLAALVHDRENREASRLVRQPSYQATLEELFRSLLALTRETHIKQLERLAPTSRGPGPVRVWVTPRLRVEPLVTYYERMADSFAFVREVLLDALGPEGLATLHRLTPDGPVDPPLAHELLWMVDLFRGCARLACYDLGLPPTPGDPAVALEWLQRWPEDPDLGQDVRCMVPLYHDGVTERTRVLAILGYAHRPLHVTFAVPPRVIDPPPDVQVAFGKSYERLVYPVSIQVDVPRLLNRDEFRRLCDAHPTVSSLRAALAE